MNQDQQNQIIRELRHRITNNNNPNGVYRCPICGSEDLVLGELLSDFRLITNSQNGNRGRTLPIATVICRHCGFISPHALGSIGQIDIYRQERDGDTNSNNQ